ncbi:MAG TPA: S1/P1 nuclease [Gammaproteobacteria bacterium]
MLFASRRIVVLALAGLAHVPALAFGPAGHRIAGEVAETLLCEQTAQEIAALTGGEPLAEIGLWADRIRGEDAWRHTGPWHYMNIDDGTPIDAFEPPDEGDVLWAIRRQAERLAEPGASERRAEALRFLVHFIVDVHQPLHVGRESDRGGNEIDVAYRGRTTNLHRFWDTEVLRVEGLEEHEYAARIAPLARIFTGHDHTSPRDWAAESLALRPLVYGFRRSVPAVLDEAYLDTAEAVARVRLAQAAVRLAATLNGLLGDNGCEAAR